MGNASTAADEAERLAAVRRYDVLDTPPDGVFDRLTALAARYFHVPIAIVSVVDTDRIWFKSRHGLDVPEVGRDPGLCASAILQEGPWIVEDAVDDPRALANPLVAGELGLRFYMGIPLNTRDGYNLGTFCVIDQEPRTVTEEEVAFLTGLAEVVMDHLELRLAARKIVDREQQLRDEAQQLSRRLQVSLLPPEIPQVPGADVAVRWQPARGEVGGDFYDLFESDDGSWSFVMGDVCGKGLEAAAVTALARYTLRAAELQVENPCEALVLLNEALMRQRPDDERFLTAVFAIAEVSDGMAHVRLSSAGHPPALIRRATGAVEAVTDGGMPLGLFDDIALRDVSADLGPGDSLLLYTDGITEARCGDDQFGLERLQRVLAETAGSSAEETASAIEDAVAAFADGDPADDAALLVFALP